MPATHAMPPVTMAALPELTLATTPARKLPTCGPAAPTTYSSAVIRPRYSSGVASWTTVPRDTTAQVSAAPATARRPRTPASEPTSPTPASDAPQTAPHARSTTPGRVRRVTSPETADADTPPTATALKSRPSVWGEPPNFCWLMTGNNAIGMARTVAHRSERKAPPSAGVLAVNRMASATARAPGLAVDDDGPSLGSDTTP